MTLQEQLAEKERQIKRIKEQRDRAEKEKGEEAEGRNNEYIRE